MPSHEKVTLVPLNTNSIEYQDVLRQFQATLPTVNVQKIERVQNPELYRTFMGKKQEMDKRCGGNSERKLFHGTDGKSIDAINSQGFNRIFCGKNGRCIWLQSPLEKTEQANSHHKKPLLTSGQGWRSGESTRLPPVWPWFESWRQRHMWVEFVVGSLPYSERFFSGYSGFPLSLKTNTFKFQFDLKRTDTFQRVLMNSLMLCG